MKNLIKNRAFTLLELLIVIAIISLILAVVMPSLYTFRDQQILKNTAEDIVTLLNQARSQTLASQNSHYYSVHIESGRVILFTDGTFSEPNSSNTEIIFDSKVSLSATGGINLNGGVSDVNFTRLTGDTVDNGTIVVQLNSDHSKTKTITIRKTGIVSSN
ncbi:MAG: type II secretion system protein [Candidatus Nomurabacteria bacterium]|nr:type II secretion system protein [Candidatus Nomurabacteria bacterium]